MTNKLCGTIIIGLLTLLFWYFCINVSDWVERFDKQRNEYHQDIAVYIYEKLERLTHPAPPCSIPRPRLRVGPSPKGEITWYLDRNIK